MEIKRTFAKRDDYTIGEVTFITPDSGFTLNGKELPAESIRHLMTFALQSLQDSYAGAKDEAEAKGNFAKKLDKILNGTIGTRDGSGGEEPWVAMAVKLFRGQLKAQVVGYDKLEAKEKDSAIAKLVKSHVKVDAIKAKAIAAIEAEKAAREELSALLAD